MARHQAATVVHTWLRSDGTASDEYTLQALYDAAGVIASKLQNVDVAILCYPPGLDFLVAFYGCFCWLARRRATRRTRVILRRGRRATSNRLSERPARP